MDQIKVDIAIPLIIIYFSDLNFFISNFIFVYKDFVIFNLDLQVSSIMIVNIMCIINYVGNHPHFTISPTFAGRNGFLILPKEGSRESSSLKNKGERRAAIRTIIF